MAGEEDERRGGRDRNDRSRGGKGRRDRSESRNEPRAETRKPERDIEVVAEKRQETIEESTCGKTPHAMKPRKSHRQPRDYRVNPANDDHRERRQRNHRRHDDGRPTPVGFGDDIPAFMLIVANSK